MQRTIIPLYYLTTQGGTFTHTCHYEGARCEISVREYDLEGIHPRKTIPEDGYNELMLYASKDEKQRLKDMPTRRNAFKPAKCFLVIDNDTTHSYQLRELCLQALLLHTTKGAVYYDFFFFDSNNINSHSTSIRAHNRDPLLLHEFPFPAYPSEFPESEFDNYCKTLQIILSDDWKKDTQYRRVLKLAMMYYSGSLRVDRWEFAYMMLSIAFEAMFKSNNENSSNPAVKRLIQLLAESRDHRKALSKALTDINTGYSAIRNAIAHGDTSFDPNSVEVVYKMFYPLVCKSIIALIQIDNESIIEATSAADYYTNLGSYLQTKFSNNQNKFI